MPLPMLSAPILSKGIDLHRSIPSFQIYCTFVYLCDVFVAEEYRGRGLSKWMMENIMGHAELRGLRRFLLATKDAHTLYSRYGFLPLTQDESSRLMGIRNDDV